MSATTLQNCCPPASSLTVRPLTFLWPGRLPVGKLAILDGDPGLGKSLVALDLCARLSTGRPFPADSSTPLTANAVVFNAEDAADGIIVPRLKALGADLDRVFVLNLEDDDRLLRLPAGIATLENIITRTKARLVVIDPVVAFLDSSVQIASDISVRHALHPLARLAESQQCVILLIRHLNKSGGRRSLYRGGGSIGFLAACRTAWLISEDPERPTCRILAQIKNNLAPPQPSLSFEIVPDPQQIPVVSWRTGTRPFTADQLLVRLGLGPALSRPLARAEDFLRSFLDDGPRTAAEVWAAAERVRLSENTVKRAKENVNIRSCRFWTNGVSVSYWLLPHQEMPAAASPESAIPDLEEWLKPLRERFPPSTPLDDA